MTLFEPGISSFSLRYSLGRLNMHQHVPDAWNPAANPVLNIMGYLMRMLHRHLRIHLHVQIHIVLMTHLAHETFLDAIYPRHRLPGLTNALHHLAAWHAVHEFIHRWPEQPPAIKCNYGRRHDGRQFVRRLITGD